jgi:hypothetical protein
VNKGMGGTSIEKVRAIYDNVDPHCTRVAVFEYTSRRSRLPGDCMPGGVYAGGNVQR